MSLFGKLFGNNPEPVRKASNIINTDWGDFEYLAPQDRRNRFNRSVYEADMSWTDMDTGSFDDGMVDCVIECDGDNTTEAQAGFAMFSAMMSRCGDINYLIKSTAVQAAGGMNGYVMNDLGVMIPNDIFVSELCVTCIEVRRDGIMEFTMQHETLGKEYLVAVNAQGVVVAAEEKRD